MCGYKRVETLKKIKTYRKSKIQYFYTQIQKILSFWYILDSSNLFCLYLELNLKVDLHQICYKNLIRDSISFK